MDPIRAPAGNMHWLTVPDLATVTMSLNILRAVARTKQSFPKACPREDGDGHRFWDKNSAKTKDAKQTFVE